MRNNKNKPKQEIILPKSATTKPKITSATAPNTQETIKNVDKDTIDKYKTELGNLLKQKHNALKELRGKDPRRETLVQEMMAIQENKRQLSNKTMTKKRFNELQGAIASRYYQRNVTRKVVNNKKNATRKNNTKRS